MPGLEEFGQFASTSELIARCVEKIGSTYILRSYPVSVVGEMSHRTAISVTNTAQQITITTNKVTMEIQNTGNSNIYLGGSGVDSDDGFLLYPGQSKVFANVKSDFSFYAVCANLETSTLRITEYA